MPEEKCNVNAPLAGGVFYLTVRRILTTGIVRLLVDSGFDNYDALMRMMPSDLQATYEFQSGTRVRGWLHERMSAILCQDWLHFLHSPIFDDFMV